VIRAKAEAENNPLLEVEVSAIREKEHGLFGTVAEINGKEYTIPLIGHHQVLNAANVLNAVEALKRFHGWKLSEEVIWEGIAATKFPARLELLHEDPVVLLDGAHNPNGMEALAASIRENLRGKRVIGVIGMLRDKDCDEALGLILPCLERVYTLTADSPRAMSAEELAEKVRGMGKEAVAGGEKESLLRQVLSSLCEDDAVVICGSLYLAADLRPTVQDLLREIFEK
jgi:dihydrofolate synthase/folylpolyglutamate synthase